MPVTRVGRPGAVRGQWQENVDMGSVSEESTMPPSSLP